MSKETVAHKKSRTFRELFWQTLARQLLLYFVPLLLLAIFFNFQYRDIIAESGRARLKIIAEHQANTLDLFLRERLVDLANVIDDPLFQQSLNADESLRNTLVKLRQASSAFVDVAVVDGEGKLTHYHGPVDFPKPVDYHQEDWYLALVSPALSRPETASMPSNTCARIFPSKWQSWTSRCRRSMASRR